MCEQSAKPVSTPGVLDRYPHRIFEDELYGLSGEADAQPSAAANNHPRLCRVRLWLSFIVLPQKGRERNMFKRQIDMRSKPINRVVALGESTTWGYSVSSKDRCWVSQVVGMLREFQGRDIKLINQGIGSNVLTPECPSYDHSAKPSALERVQNDLIIHHPDLVFLSYGLNDSRGGTPVRTFRQAYQELIDRIRNAIDPVIVLVNTYYMHEVLYSYLHWAESSYELTEVFNLVIKQLAETNNCILADVYSAEVGVDWIIDEDHCHPNDLGHRMIANRVFEAIARNCSFVACRMPKKTLISQFSSKHGNGPEKSSSNGTTKDVMLPKTK